MYREHYGLKVKPFEIDPDPKFLWIGQKHKETLATLKKVILENKGIVFLMGEPGTGKSALLNSVAHLLGKPFRFAKISDPSLSELDFFKMVATAFGIEKSFNSREGFFNCLKQFARDAFAGSSRFVLIIDDAHRLSVKLLEHIRLISNIRKAGRFLINVVFAGQKEFDRLLKSNRAFSQALAMSYTLQPLTETEAAEYIKHRLQVAGSETEIFTSNAIAEIFHLSGGIPRLINIISENALLSGYAQNIKVIGSQIIMDLQGPGHRLIHEICELDKEFTSQLPAHLQKIREKAVLATKVPPLRKKRPLDKIIRLFQNLLGRLRLKLFTVKGTMAVSISLIALLGLFGYAHFHFPNADDEQLLTKIQNHSEKGSQGKLSAEASSKDAELQEMRRSLEASKSQQQAMAEEIKKVKSDNAQLQVQLADLKSQKVAAESQLNQQQSKSNAAAADLNEFKAAKKRLGELEGEAAVKDQKLAQLEQSLKALEKDLSLEKGSKGKLSAEASSKDAELQELRRSLEASKSQQQAMAEEVQKVKSDNAQLQVQLADLKSQKVAAQPSSDVSQTPAAASKPAVERSEKARAAQPAPTDIIDFVMKKKKQ